jgi:hypothetical protein
MEPKQQLGAAIRQWIHMDNLVESFSHQASNARKLRNKHEADAVGLIHQIGLQDSTIKVSGATLHLAKKKSQSGLTWGFLEKEIDAWSKKTGIKTAGLLTWLHDHREVTEVEYLKKDAEAK